MILMCLLIILCTFLTIFMKKKIPLIKLKRSNRKSQPRSQWITHNLLKSINYKNKLYRKFLHSPSDVNRFNFTKILSRPFYVLLNKLIFPSNLRRRKITSEIPGRLLTVSLKVTLPHTFLVLMLIVTVLTILFSLQSIIMISLSILDPILPIKFRIAIHIFRILL